MRIEVKGKMKSKIILSLTLAVALGMSFSVKDAAATDSAQKAVAPQTGT